MKYQTIALLLTSARCQDSAGLSWKESEELTQEMGQRCNAFQYDKGQYQTEGTKSMWFDRVRNCVTAVGTAEGLDDCPPQRFLNGQWSYLDWENATGIDRLRWRYYDPLYDTCPTGQTCSLWVKSVKMTGRQFEGTSWEFIPIGFLMQTCQVCTNENTEEQAYASINARDSTFYSQYTMTEGVWSYSYTDDNDPAWKQKVRYANDVPQLYGLPESADGMYSNTFQCIVSPLKGTVPSDNTGDYDRFDINNQKVLSAEDRAAADKRSEEDKAAADNGSAEDKPADDKRSSSSYLVYQASLAVAIGAFSMI